MCDFSFLTELEAESEEDDDDEDDDGKKVSGDTVRSRGVVAALSPLSPFWFNVYFCCSFFISLSLLMWLIY